MKGTGVCSMSCTGGFWLYPALKGVNRPAKPAVADATRPLRRAVGRRRKLEGAPPGPDLHAFFHAARGNLPATFNTAAAPHSKLCVRGDPMKPKTPKHPQPTPKPSPQVEDEDDSPDTGTDPGPTAFEDLYEPSGLQEFTSEHVVPGDSE